jgi:uncharacterized membrane protein
MKSSARIKDHPLHPMLVLLPAGAFLTALIMDIVYIVSGSPLWYEATFPVIIIGLVGAAIAAVPGIMDLVSIAPKKQATRVGVAHMATNFVLIAVFILNASVRYGAGIPEAGSLYGGFWLSLLGNALLVLGGWLGGKLVYEYRVGVLEDEDYDLFMAENEARQAERGVRPEIQTEA